MEFSDVGAHCAYDLCGQQTFLPFDCESCKRKFCKIHRVQQSHECPHLSQEIKEAKRIEKAKIKANKKKKINEPIHKCHYKKCKRSEWIKIECAGCNNSFCLKHRSPDAHKCDKDKLKTLRQQRQSLINKHLTCSQQMMKQNANSNANKHKPSIFVQ
eukprot:271343_1